MLHGGAEQPGLAWSAPQDQPHPPCHPLFTCSMNNQSQTSSAPRPAWTLESRGRGMKRGPALQRPGRLQFLQSVFRPCVPQPSSRPPLGLSLFHACHLQQTFSAPQGILILPIHPEQLSLASASSGRSAQITPRLGILFAHRLFLARVGSSHTQGREEVLEHESSHPKPWTNGCQELVDDASTPPLVRRP